MEGCTDGKIDRVRRCDDEETGELEEEKEKKKKKKKNNRSNPGLLSTHYFELFE